MTWALMALTPEVSVHTCTSCTPATPEWRQWSLVALLGTTKATLRELPRDDLLGETEALLDQLAATRASGLWRLLECCETLFLRDNNERRLTARVYRPYSSGIKDETSLIRTEPKSAERWETVRGGEYG